MLEHAQQRLRRWGTLGGEDAPVLIASDAQMQCGLSPAVWAIALEGGRLGGVELDACIATRQELLLVSRYPRQTCRR